jgi:hypothetical protein
LSSGQSSWLQIQRSGFDYRHYQIIWEVVGLERGPLRLMSTIEELLGRKSSGFGLESREYGRRDPSRWPRGTLYPQKLALTWTTCGCRSVGTVSSRTLATEFSLVSNYCYFYRSYGRVVEGVSEMSGKILGRKVSVPVSGFLSYSSLPRREWSTSAFLWCRGILLFWSKDKSVNTLQCGYTSRLICLQSAELIRKSFKCCYEIQEFGKDIITFLNVTKFL